MLLQNNMTKSYRIFKNIIIAWLIMVLVGFIISSIYDYRISEYFSKFNINILWRRYSLFFDKLGLSVAVPFVFIQFGIIVETLVYKYKSKKPSIYKMVWIFYIGFITIFLLENVVQVYMRTTANVGFGPGMDIWFALGRWELAIVFTIHAAIQLVLISISIWWLRTRFSKREDILIQNYWIDVTKCLVLFTVLETSIYILKPISGRPYFLDVNRVEVWNMLPNSYKDASIQYANGTVWEEFANRYMNHLPINSNSLNAKYIDWWDIQLFNKEYWDVLFNGILDKNGYTDIAFPSGHMNASTICVMGITIPTISVKKQRKITWWKWLGITITFLTMMLISLGELISRTHYLSDLTFACLFSILLSFPITYGTDKVVYYSLIKIWSKKNKKFVIKISLVNKKYIFYIVVNNVEWRINSSFSKNKKVNELKKYKYLEKYNAILI